MNSIQPDQILGPIMMVVLLILMQRCLSMSAQCNQHLSRAADRIVNGETKRKEKKRKPMVFGVFQNWEM
jgi:hypothetical protein